MKNIFRKVKDSITGQDKTLENRWLNHVQSYPAYQSKPDLGFFDCHLVTDNFLRKIGTKIPSLRNISGIFLPPPIQAKSFKIWEMEGFKNKTNLPVSINGSPVHENFLHFHPKYSSRNSFITCVQNGFFHGSDHTLFDNKLTPIDWEAPYWALRYSLPGSMFRTRFSSPINLKGKTLVLSAPGADSNIWHFFYDSLPKLCLIEKAGINIKSFDHIVVSSSRFEYQRSALQRIGVDTAKVVGSDKMPFIRSDEIFYVTLGCLLPPDKWVIEWLRTKMLMRQNHSRQMIFISRSKANYRRLMCEVELLEKLPSDFLVLHLEKMSLDEQIEAFQSASVVISPHGAGLTNLTWCAPGTKVIELFSSKYKSVCYWMTSNHLALQYGYAIGDVAPGETDSGVAIMNQSALGQDIYFNNVDKLAQNILYFIH